MLRCRFWGLRIITAIWIGLWRMCGSLTEEDRRDGGCGEQPLAATGGDFRGARVLMLRWLTGWMMFRLRGA